ncbi:MauE/DoxX family redox-associated membrane protein [Pedobacter sp. MW01-1-1]|uniref:MauE/DoxX family redox-associated membrane protein n=1 Tax=Pedobacter sp. MW01-1-1 TaxID=3383027 RepID=UPI003FEF01EC
MKNLILFFSTGLLIILWVYSGGSKILDFQDFKHQLRLQHFGATTSAVLLWLIPAIEILTAILLAIDSLRAWGLYLSGLLLALFTGYVALILSGAYIKTPCSCGGVLKWMSWKTHLVFNFTFLSLNILAVFLFIKQGRRFKK